MVSDADVIVTPVYFGGPGNGVLWKGHAPRRTRRETTARLMQTGPRDQLIVRVDYEQLHGV
jgi:hypothetical protein